ncbi:hypothetical protein Peur_011441 [Populus x canadensis]
MRRIHGGGGGLSGVRICSSSSSFNLGGGTDHPFFSNLKLPNLLSPFLALTLLKKIVFCYSRMMSPLRSLCILIEDSQKPHRLNFRGRRKSSGNSGAPWTL